MKNFLGPVAILALVVILACASSIKTARAGILSDVRRDASEPSSSWSSDDDDDDSSSGHFSGSHYSHCDDDDDDSSLFGAIFGWMFQGIAHVAFGGLRNEGYDYKFPPFPYYQSNGYQESLVTKSLSDLGYDISSSYGETIDMPDCEETIDLRCDHLRRISFRFDSEYGTDTAQLSRIGSHLMMSSSQGLGIDTEFSYFIEKQTDAPDDNLWLGDINVIYRFIESENIQWRWGLGMNWLTSQGITKTGFNFTMSADLYLGKPWIVSTGFDVGTIGETDLFQFRITAGINIRHVEAYTGYQYYDIGTSQMNFLIAGARVWW